LLKLFKTFAILYTLTISYNIIERDTHFLLEGTTDGSLERLLSLNLLIEYPKGNILEIGDGRYLVVENNLLCDNVDQISAFDIFNSMIVADLVGYPLGE
jgi:hypothetical protein